MRPVAALLAACCLASPSGVGAQSLLAAGAARVPGGADTDARTATYLRATGSWSGSVSAVEVEGSGRAWVDLERVRSSLLDVEVLAVLEPWTAAELRAGVGDLAWGLSEIRSPVDVLIPRAVLWDQAAGPRLAQLMVGLTLFRAWGSVEAVALPYSRPLHLGRLLTDTWGGHSIRSTEEWGDHAAGGARVTSVMGPVDLAVSYIHGSDRRPWFRLDASGDAVTRSPTLRQGAYELQWVVGSFVLRSEGALARRDRTWGTRLIVGGAWYATPYLTLELGHGVTSRDAEAESPLVDDLSIAGLLIAEDLRLRARLFVDTGSGNRHYLVTSAWRLGEYTSVEAELVGAAGDPAREPGLALRQRVALFLSLVRYF